ncbi:MAG: hypothetical protein QG670_649 [Thermoproteota archaeon]|nr:hypothetical protein [Thermoproteota archaeon]
MVIGFGRRPILPRLCLHPNFDHSIVVTVTLIYFVHYHIINCVQKHKIKILEVKKNMGWRGQWPGRGPFSNLPPLHRPGRLYGRGACWRLYSPSLQTNIPQAPNTTLSKEQEISILEDQAKLTEQMLAQIRKQLEELKK